MNTLLVAACLSLVLTQVVAPPRRRGEEQGQEHHEGKEEEELAEMKSELGIEYVRYLKEVVELLESDDEFKKKLQSADEADIRSGKIAHELEYVNHNVRTKLDEVKRQEVERLRHLAQRDFELKNNIDIEHIKGLSAHVDHDNPHTFEMEDLKKLIAKATEDLEENDKQRREEFKEYEMQKEFEKQEKLKHLEGDDKIAFEKQLKDNETKHKQHQPLHHPGSRQQLEEVWEKQDHMDNQEFNPKVFFQLHDLDGNGYWDQDEVKTLFLKELDKLYQSGAPEDDMRERAEELERMREHVFSEADKNRDSLISYEEFLEQTKRADFNKDPEWEGIESKHEYTQEEYHEFERRRQAEVQRMIQQGLIPPQPVYPDAYHYQQQYHHQQQFPNQGQYVHPDQAYQHQGQAQHHPNQMPQHPNQYPSHPNAVPQHQQFAQHPNQVPQHPNQVPDHLNAAPHQQQYIQHPNQVPQYPNQVPPHPNQVPQHPNQVPQQHPNQVPQQYPNQVPQQQPNQVPQQHPNQIPQQHPNQVPQQQPNQVPQQHPNQVPQQHPNQVPQQHPNQVPQQHPNQVPQQHPNQVPQQHPNQVPQQHPNQVPQQHPNQVPQQHPNQVPQHINQAPQYPNQVVSNPNDVSHGGQPKASELNINQAASDQVAHAQKLTSSNEIRH